MDLKSKKILIAGAGISGIGAAALLGKAGIPAAIYDGNEALDQKAVVAKLPVGMVARCKGTRCKSGAVPAAVNPHDVDWIV